MMFNHKIGFCYISLSVSTWYTHSLKFRFGSLNANSNQHSHMGWITCGHFWCPLCPFRNHSESCWHSLQFLSFHPTTYYSSWRQATQCLSTSINASKIHLLETSLHRDSSEYHLRLFYEAECPCNNACLWCDLVHLLKLN